MHRLRIHLFGKFLVQDNEQILDGFDAHKVQELFSYLLLHREHPICRERLAGILWSESLEEQAKKKPASDPMATAVRPGLSKSAC